MKRLSITVRLTLLFIFHNPGDGLFIRSGKKIMKRLSITVRLTLLFILLLSVAGAGIVWTLYNGLASELKWRDDTTLINRTAQIKQLLIDGVNPDAVCCWRWNCMDSL